MGFFVLFFCFLFCWGGVMQRKENNKITQAQKRKQQAQTRNEKTLIVTDQG